MDRETVLIIDFGAQYTQLIARRIREAHVYALIESCHSVDLDSIKRLDPKAIVLSGGPASVKDVGAPRIDKRIFDMGIPILGICYGLQLIAQELGGRVAQALRHEYGRARIKVDTGSDLFHGLEQEIPVWMSHADRIEAAPGGFETISSTDSAPIAAIADRARKIYGVQFHPEVAHTPDGAKILTNFVYRIAGLEGSWTMSSFISESVAAIRDRVGDKRVILALSGGVDSSVCARLIDEAVGDKLVSIFVDNGFLRSGEAEQVMELYADHFHMDIRKVDAADLFIDRLKGVSDPQQKRKIIGRTFADVFIDAAASIEGASFLAQGTLYPDVIESVSAHGPSAVIKTHHNLELGEKLKLDLIEPLRSLFKDEARMVGSELGLPRDILWRHPFPGPGLAIRLIGEVTRERLFIAREADRIIIEELRQSGWYDRVWQAFGVLTPVKSVGVMGDARTYENLLAIRAVNSSDAMTADWARLPDELLATMSNRIINEVDRINRVVYDITSKPPGTIEWE